MTSPLEQTSMQPDSPDLSEKARGLLELMRFHKPIGTWLLAAPTTWALALAAGGWPGWQLAGIFALGTVVMRSAGCVANDLADRNLDGFVERTKTRPLITGSVSVNEAVLLLLALLAIALGLVSLTNAFTVMLSVIGAGLALAYPYMKRYTYLPQFVLGAAFSWSIPMAFTAVNGTLDPALWWLFAANLIWTVVYDTQYAMVDREDDLSVGIKSTAILFGQLDRRIIALMQLLAIACFLKTGSAFELTWPYHIAIGCVAVLFAWHQWLIRDREESECFRAFNQSKWIGAIILLGIVGHFSLGNVSPP